MWCLPCPLEGRARTLVFVTYGIQMHPTDTEHKWPRGTDGEHVTPEAIMVQLSTNLSLCYKSHVYSLTPVSHQFKGSQHVATKGTVNKTVSALQSFFHAESFVVHQVFLLGRNHHKKFCVPASPSPPTCIHLGANIKRTSLEAMEMRARVLTSHFVFLL